MTKGYSGSAVKAMSLLLSYRPLEIRLKCLPFRITVWQSNKALKVLKNQCLVTTNKFKSLHKIIFLLYWMQRWFSTSKTKASQTTLKSNLQNRLRKRRTWCSYLIGFNSPLAMDLHVLRRLSPLSRIQTIFNTTKSLK